MVTLMTQSKVEIVYKGPHADLSTAPCCYSQTVRNIPVSEKSVFSHSGKESTGIELPSSKKI